MHDRKRCRICAISICHAGRGANALPWHRPYRVASHAVDRVGARYWPVLGYLFVLLLTAQFTQFPLFVLLEVLSLASAIVFAIAYFESPQRTLQTISVNSWYASSRCIGSS